MKDTYSTEWVSFFMEMSMEMSGRGCGGNLLIGWERTCCYEMARLENPLRLNNLHPLSENTKKEADAHFPASPLILQSILS